MKTTDLWFFITKSGSMLVNLRAKPENHDDGTNGLVLINYVWRSMKRNDWGQWCRKRSKLKWFAWKKSLKLKAYQRGNNEWWERQKKKQSLKRMQSCCRKEEGEGGERREGRVGLYREGLLLWQGVWIKYCIISLTITFNIQIRWPMEDVQWILKFSLLQESDN